LDGRKIDFRLVNPAEEFSPRQLRDKSMNKAGSRGATRGTELSAEGIKAKPNQSRPFKGRKMEGLSSPNRQAKTSAKGATSKSTGQKKSTQARKNRR
jgi:hypothetical protein